MPYIIIEDFRAGLDRRKLPVSSPPGSLQTLSNGHVTRGGEIEKRLAMVPTYGLPPGQTFGLAGANGKLYTFGSDASPAVPTGITYQRLVHPSGHAMTGIVSTEFYDGKLSVVATFANGDTLIFYDGTRIADWATASGATVAGKKPTSQMTQGDKLYATFESILAWSSIGAPTLWQTGTGYGFKNMSNQAAGSEGLTALGSYQNYVAVFARRNTQIWYLDPDPLQNARKQVLANIGTYAPKSVISFGAADVFFLSDSGIRSLRARDASIQAGVSDVGTPIDDYLLEYLSGLTEAERTAAVGVLEPLSGRYFLAVGTRVFVFSYFASAKISAWSTYDLDFAVSSFVALDGRVWARGTDIVYLLGGDNGKTYDAAVVEIDLPYIDGRQVATFKDFIAIDVVCSGEWEVYVNTDPNNPTAESRVAIINSTTLTLDTLGLVGHSPVIKLRLVSVGSTAARLSKVIVHYSQAEAS
jgi:hypothetical protein